MTVTDHRSTIPTSNYMVGRSGNPVSLLIEHWIGSGTVASALARFRDPSSRVSAHYIVAQDGEIHYVVDEADTAYHAGEFQANQLSVGIEHEATPGLLPSAALYRSSAWLHRRFSEQYGIRLEVGRTVRPHNYYRPTQCPGTLDLARIVEEANDMAFTDEDRAKLDRVLTLLEARESLVWTARLQRSLDVERGLPYDETIPPIDPRIR